MTSPTHTQTVDDIRAVKLERSIEQYRNGKPEVIIEGSKAQVLFALQDARKDVLTLAAAVQHEAQLKNDAHQIVQRIWAIFGTPSYDELQGRSIYDLVSDAVSRASETDRMRERIAALEAERDTLKADYQREQKRRIDAEVNARTVLEPFSKFAGVVFERNFNNDDPVDCMTASDGGQATIYARDFFAARAFLAKEK